MVTSIVFYVFIAQTVFSRYRKRDSVDYAIGSLLPTDAISLSSITHSLSHRNSLPLTQQTAARTISTTTLNSFSSLGAYIITNPGGNFLLPVLNTCHHQLFSRAMGCLCPHPFAKTTLTSAGCRLKCKLPSLGCAWHTSPLQVTRDLNFSATNIPILCFSKHDVSVYNPCVCACVCTSVDNSRLNILYVVSSPRCVICRCGAIPLTTGRGPFRVGSVSGARNPFCGWSVGGRRGGSNGLRRAKGRRQQKPM